LGVEQRRALIRHFGKDTEIYFERNSEEIIFQSCAKAKLSPGYIASFPGGRIEEYLDAHTLNSDDCRSFLTHIATKTAEVHHHQMDELPKEPSIFTTITKWLKKASEVELDDAKEPTKRLWKEIDFQSLKQEVEFQKSIILPLNSPVVFCHNDLLLANFMYNSKTEQFYVIDYEYANYNYRGYDLGNHFAEWIIDYTRKDYPKFYFKPENYPSHSERDTFIRTYLTKAKQLNGQDNPTLEDSEISQIQKEIDHFLLLSHFTWSIWAIIQAATSPIDFGYMEFSSARLNHYFDLKKALIKKYKIEIKAKM